MLKVITNKPVAVDSPDHLHPKGTMRDNSVNPEFNRRLYSVLRERNLAPTVLDLGCAGGGFVKSILDDGFFAVGIEGSDYSKVRQRAEWATIPDFLFTADATEPFTVEDATGPLQFSAITSWEFMEHIADANLAALFSNIRRHLNRGGLFISSTNTIPDDEGGHGYHQTVRPAAWWNALYEHLGWEHDYQAEETFGGEYVHTDASSLCAALRIKTGGRP